MNGLETLLRDPNFAQAVEDAPTLLDYANNPSLGGLARVIGLAGRVFSEKTSPTRTDDVSLGIMPGLPSPAGPATGFVRLFRGEGSPDPLGPYWKDPKMNELAGRWFTPDRNLARFFANDAPIRRLGVGRQAVVDVPEEVFKASQVAGNPALEPYAYGATEPGAVVLPPEWVARARRIFEARPAP